MTLFAFVLVCLPAIAAIVGSRALSQVQVGPIFVFDVLLIPAMGAAAFLLVRFRSDLHRRAIFFAAPMLVLPIVVAGVLVTDRLTSVTALRDAHPFLMLGYGAAVAGVLAVVPNWVLNYVVKLLIPSLWLHWSWVSLVMFLDFLPGGYGDLSKYVRSDLDGMLIGALSAAMLLFARSGFFPLAVVAVISSLLMVQVAVLGSRAALLATVLMVVITAILRYRVAETGYKRSWRTWLLAPSVTLVLGLVGGLVISSSTADRLGAILELPSYLEQVEDSPELTPGGDTQSERPEHTAELGTTVARVEAWRTLLEYARTEGALLSGFGLGSDYLYESGATADLIGEQGAEGKNATRHPHNFLLWTTAVLGAPAGLFLAAIIPTYLLLALHSRRGGQNGDIAILLVCGYSVTSLVGVIFEGPYGSVPMSWALGVLISTHIARK